MTTCLVLGVDRLAVDDDVEHTFRAGVEAELGYDVLIVAEKIVGNAHGVLGIVSGDTVGEVYHVFHTRFRVAVGCHQPESHRLVLEAMSAVVIYESLTGNTKTAAFHIAAQLEASGVEAVACPITQIDLQALSQAELVVVGSWTDGVFIAGQRPGRSGRLRKMPRIDGLAAAVYCTYAIDPGKTLDKMEKIVADRGGNVIGGYAIQRSEIADGAAEFVARLLGAMDKAGASA